ncbi:unnamed protein product [Parascedosporium putredinis]|uniref:Thioesterase domain-containing protein n=1 Tax=Parascedosporium putredinis TaxID=1442378 RepID=A0A9P1M7T4_9PEZI|nr:unnamed protein product [Parascedosporium putredinis]CAI7991154.1 unnamed protein product [Parascedosporium putredinis]
MRPAPAPASTLPSRATAAREPFSRAYSDAGGDGGGPSARGRLSVLEDVKERLRLDQSEGTITIDADNKTVDTAAGKLPSRPPDARLPVRNCAMTRTRLPRDFLQEFRPVLEPTTQQPCHPHSDDTTAIVKGSRGPVGYLLAHQSVTTPPPRQTNFRHAVSRSLTATKPWKMNQMPGNGPRVARRHERDPARHDEARRRRRPAGTGALEVAPSDDSPSFYSTYDVEGVRFGAKIPVHNLRVVLGPAHFAELRAASPIFRDTHMALLARVRSTRVQKLLWRIQGYMAVRTHPFDPTSDVQRDNPEIIQPPHPSHPTSHLPIILIHDGGGTCFAYCCLDTVPRAMYGIHNPHFWSGDPWTGGIPEMAAAYTKIIRALRFLLGGWSLGGILSLQITKELQSTPDPDIEIAGLLLIDSMYPVSLSPNGPPYVPISSSLPALAPGATKTQVLSRACMTKAAAMLLAWTAPVLAHPVPPPSSSRPATPSPWALTLTTGDDGVQTTTVSAIDTHRADRELGWGHYRPGWIRAVYDVPGDHFSMFSIFNAEAMTPVVERACRTLESLAERA